MEWHDVAQGEDDWYQLRLARITASRFKDVMTEPRSKADREAGALSDTARSYMMELLGEYLTGQAQFFSNSATDWGNTYEDEAVSAYEARSGVIVQRVGMVTQGKVGASPDGLVGDSGGIEVKCPFNPKNHIETLLNGMPKQHVAQVQGGMWLTGRDWWDFISYDPRIIGDKGLYVERIERDEEYIERLAGKVGEFERQLEAAIFRLEA